MHITYWKGQRKQIGRGSQTTELACQGASYPAMIKEAENQGTALEFLAPANSLPEQQLEIAMPQGCSCCLQRRAAPARRVPAKPACPAPNECPGAHGAGA